MKRIMIVPALLTLWAQPALSGDGDEYDVYETYRYESRANGADYGYDAVPTYDTSDYVVTDDAPLGHDTRCEVEREWSPGRYSETVECEED